MEKNNDGQDKVTLSDEIERLRTDTPSETALNVVAIVASTVPAPLAGAVAALLSG